MPARKSGAPKEDAPPTKAPAKKEAAKRAAPAPPAPARDAPAPESAPKPARARRPAGAPPVDKTRVVVPKVFYEENKDALKAPFKELALKWNFLGPGKGLYKREDAGVHCFVQFKDDGVHYAVWGTDKAACGELLATWRALLGEAGWAAATASGEDAVAAEKDAAESDAMRLWRLAEPQPRPGEPDLFLRKRVSEWQAKKPV